MDNDNISKVIGLVQYILETDEIEIKYHVQNEITLAFYSITYLSRTFILPINTLYCENNFDIAFEIAIGLLCDDTEKE